MEKLTTGTLYKKTALGVQKLCTAIVSGRNKLTRLGPNKYYINK